MASFYMFLVPFHSLVRFLSTYTWAFYRDWQTSAPQSKSMDPATEEERYVAQDASVRNILINRNVGHVGRIVSDGRFVVVGRKPDAENTIEQINVQSKLSQNKKACHVSREASQAKTPLVGVVVVAVVSSACLFIICSLCEEYEGDLGLGDGWRPTGGSATVSPWTGVPQHGVTFSRPNVVSQCCRMCSTLG